MLRNPARKQKLRNEFPNAQDQEGEISVTNP